LIKKDDNTSVCTLTSTKPSDLQPLSLSDFFGDCKESVGFISIATLPQLLSVDQSICGSNVTVKLQYVDADVCFRAYHYILPVVFSVKDFVVLKIPSNIFPGQYTLEIAFCGTSEWRSTGHELFIKDSPKVLAIEPTLIFSFTSSVIKLRFSREPVGQLCHFGPFLDFSRHCHR